MPESNSPRSEIADQTSFHAVVKAEQAADDQLATGRAGAEAIRQDAAARERRIARRSDQRLQALHAAMQAKIAADRTRLVEAFKAERRDLAAVPGIDEIEAAVRKLARRLVGLDQA